MREPKPGVLNELTGLVDLSLVAAAKKAIIAFNRVQVKDESGFTVSIAIDESYGRGNKVAFKLETDRDVVVDFFDPRGGHFWVVAHSINVAKGLDSLDDDELLVKAQLNGVNVTKIIGNYTRRRVKLRHNPYQTWSDAMEEISEALSQAGES